MAVFIADWNAAAAIWGDQMWAVLWQSTLLAAVAALVSVLLLRRSSPGVRYWVWQIVAIKLLVMPFWTYAIPLTQVIPAMPGREPTGSSAQMAVAHDGPPSRPLRKRSTAEVPTAATELPPSIVDDVPPAVSSGSRISGLGWLLSLWGFFVMAQCSRILWHHRRLARLLRGAQAADATLSTLVCETARRLGLRRAPRTVMTDVDCSPFVCGVRRAVLVLPRGLTATLSATELNQVLLHELAHVRRLDLVWGWIGEIARIAYFFHPAVHWIVYQIRLERELACDQMAMAASGQHADEYAAMLVRVVSQTSEPSVFKTSAASAGLHGESA